MKPSEMTCPKCGNQSIVEIKPWFSKSYLWCNHTSGFIFKSSCGWDQRTDKVGLNPANLKCCPDCGRDTVSTYKPMFGKSYRYCTHSGFLGFGKCGWDENKADRILKEAEEAKAKQAVTKKAPTPARRENSKPKCLKCSMDGGYWNGFGPYCRAHMDEVTSAAQYFYDQRNS